MRSTLFIHAGFPKCASSTIQSAIVSNIAALNSDGLYPIGADLRLIHNQRDGLPLWALKNMIDRRQIGIMRDIIKAGVEDAGGGNLVLTAENLADAWAPNLFVGCEEFVDIRVIFYFRPQFDYIPSAWKQWAIKNGRSLPDFAKHCLELNRPTYLKILSSWQSVLPNASIRVIPLVSSFLIGGSPISDFFSQIDFSGKGKFDADRRVNTSMDYSLLHVLMRGHAKLFNGTHDNIFLDKLESALPEYAKRLNAELLSFKMKKRIEQHFEEENMRILRQFCSIPDIHGFYNEHFLAGESETVPYHEMDKAIVVTRCIKILSESKQTEEVTALASIACGLLTAR